MSQTTEAVATARAHLLSTPLSLVLGAGSGLLSSTAHSSASWGAEVGKVLCHAALSGAASVGLQQLLALARWLLRRYRPRPASAPTPAGSSSIPDRA